MQFPIFSIAILLSFAALLPCAFGNSGADVTARRLYHGTAYYPELWPEEDITRDIAEMHRLGIGVARIGEFAWSRMEPEEGAIDLGFFRRTMDRLHKAGIRTILCTPTATPPVWLTHGHPERAFVNREGQAMGQGARQHASYDDPVVRAACLRIVEALTRELGRHPGLLAWQIDNELRCHVAEDFNPASIAGWHEWLKNRYGTIQRLNEAWGTEIWSQRYQRFEQVPAPLRTPFLHNASLSSAYLAYSREGINDFVAEQCTAIRRHSTAPITHNTSLGFSIHQEGLHKYLDFASFDAYPQASNWARWVLNCDTFRAAVPGRSFWVMETSPAHNGWLGSNHETTHPKGYLRAEAVVAYSLGAEGFSYWLWRQQRTGCELPHSAILSAWGKPTIGTSEVGEVEKARRALEPILADTNPVVPEVALTWSDAGRAQLQTEALGAGGGHKVDYNTILADWHRILLDGGIPRDVRFEGAALDGIKLLITPAMLPVRRDWLDRIRAWVNEGGVWLCGPLTGARTPEHTVPTDAALGPLEKIGGVETVYAFPVTGTSTQGAAFGIKAVLAGWCHAWRAAAGTTMLGLLEGPLVQDLAWITERRVGKGAILLLGCEPQGERGREILAKLVEKAAVRAGVTARYDATPGTIVCPRARPDGTPVWIVVNFDGAGGEVRLPEPAEDLLGGGVLQRGTLRLARYEWRALCFRRE